MSKSVLVIGASRGIGRQVALTLSHHNYKVGVLARTQVDSEKTPGTIFSVRDEIEAQGGTALALPCNVRNPEEIEQAINLCIKDFGHLDALIYNAGAIMWKPVSETSIRQYEMMHDVNIRGAYCAVQQVLPHFMQRNAGRILLVAPPIYSRFFNGKTPYSITKVGMTILACGLGKELTGSGVCVSALWPATVIESRVTEVMKVPETHMRKATVFADACLRILEERTERYNGEALLDEDLLRDSGVTDFTKYRCDPQVEPPRMMPKVLPTLRVAEEELEMKSNL